MHTDICQLKFLWLKFLSFDRKIPFIRVILFCFVDFLSIFVFDSQCWLVLLLLLLWRNVELKIIFISATYACALIDLLCARKCYKRNEFKSERVQRFVVFLSFYSLCLISLNKFFFAFGDSIATVSKLSTVTTMTTMILPAHMIHICHRRITKHQQCE